MSSLLLCDIKQARACMHMHVFFVGVHSVCNCTMELTVSSLLLCDIKQLRACMCFVCECMCFVCVCVCALCVRAFGV